VPAQIVRLVEERRRFWRTLQNLAGIDAAKLDEAHQAELDGLQSRYDEALAEIEALKGAATNAAE
jgi:pyruvate-ferredoxin/flavodoxin oxidoreductase